MLPTFKEDGDVVIVQRLDHSKRILGKLLFNTKDENGKARRDYYKKGDAVICYCKDDLDKTVCKRVAAVEGDRVSYRGNGNIALLYEQIGLNIVCDCVITSELYCHPIINLLTFLLI